MGTAAAQTIQHITAQNVKTANNSTTTARDSSRVPQLHKGIPSAKQYILPTPLRVECLQVLLQHHPQQDRVCYVLNGLSHGFSLEYEGQQSFRAPDNLPSADTKPELIWERLYKEVQLGRMWGLFKEPPFQHLMCSQSDWYPKKDSEEMRMIMHLSFPYGSSINDFIDQDKSIHTVPAVQ